MTDGTAPAGGPVFTESGVYRVPAGVQRVRVTHILSDRRTVERVVAVVPGLSFRVSVPEGLMAIVEPESDWE